MPFYVKEIFSTLQGEGSRTGSPAVFVRLAGCNLWSGSESDREKGVGVCSQWCDTDFQHGQPLSCEELFHEISAKAFLAGMERPLVVFSGGEPLLQLGQRQHLDDSIRLLTELLRSQCATALETNGTRPMPRELAPFWSHVTVSPKALKQSPAETSHLKAFTAHDLKIVVPTEMSISDLQNIYRGAFFYFQPLHEAGQPITLHLEKAIKLAAKHGGRVSLQTHKLIGLP